MKSFFSNTLYLGFLMLLMGLGACQNEIEEISTGDEPEAILANSNTALLVQQATTKDGSFDNIVDGTSCFDIKFPYTIKVNGLEITITGKESLELVEAILDELDSDNDLLEIFFPITLTAGDYSEISIGSLDALQELAEECLEGGEDEDIECIDFVYPVTLFTFDVALEKTGNTTVESDKQLRRFFANLDDDDLVSFDFPIALKKYDGTEITVNNNMELARAIDSARDACDEDDDNDYNDDDFDADELDGYLAECRWSVKRFTRNDQDRFAEYRNYTIQFKAEGTVTVTNGDTQFTGSYQTTVNQEGALLTMTIEGLEDFTLSWRLYEMNEDRIKLFNGESNRVVLETFCGVDHDGSDNGGTPSLPAILANELQKCPWVIDGLTLQNEALDRVFANTLTFGPEGALQLGMGQNATTGTWEVTEKANKRLFLNMVLEEEPGLTLEWPLKHADNGKMVFKKDEFGHELEIIRVCEPDEEITNINALMLEGEWEVASYIDEGENETTTFSGYGFTFDAFGEMTLKEGNDPFAKGLWNAFRDDRKEAMVYLNFGDIIPLQELTEEWTFLGAGEDTIELKYVDGNGMIKTVLTLKKK
ncbi:hypothetical protein [Maribacter sp. 2307ULW6-5]|uniref:hypothetical protein n=1 Tax=Maribacter sp. 2307ULW6-5 TaxID=3386275 RepID=UPI0039BC3C22